MSIIVNSTPLISLAVINQLEILKKIFDDVIVPKAVYDEIIKDGKGKVGYSQLADIKWFNVVNPINIELKHSIMLQLDEGESEVITIAKDRNISLVCIDEFAGRQYASRLKLDVIGTLGVLLIAKKQGYINSIKPLCDILIDNGRYIGHSLYNEVLKKANEI